MALVTLASACQEDKYVANVTELSLVRMDPESGYSGAIVKVLGRNFSEKAKDNVVLIGGKEAKVLDANKWDLVLRCYLCLPLPLFRLKSTFYRRRSRFPISLYPY